MHVVWNCICLDRGYIFFYWRFCCSYIIKIFEIQSSYVPTHILYLLLQIKFSPFSSTGCLPCSLWTSCLGQMSAMTAASILTWWTIRAWNCPLWSLFPTLTPCAPMCPLCLSTRRRSPGRRELCWSTTSTILRFLHICWWRFWARVLCEFCVL